MIQKTTVSKIKFTDDHIYKIRDISITTEARDARGTDIGRVVSRTTIVSDTPVTLLPLDKLPHIWLKTDQLNIRFSNCVIVEESISHMYDGIFKTELTFVSKSQTVLDIN